MISKRAFKHSFYLVNADKLKSLKKLLLSYFEISKFCKTVRSLDMSRGSSTAAILEHSLSWLVLHSLKGLVKI